MTKELEENILTNWLFDIRQSDDEATEHDILETIIYITVSLMIDEASKPIDLQEEHIPFFETVEEIKNRTNEFIGIYMEKQND